MGQLARMFLRDAGLCERGADNAIPRLSLVHWRVFERKSVALAPQAHVASTIQIGFPIRAMNL